MEGLPSPGDYLDYENMTEDEQNFFLELKQQENMGRQLQNYTEENQDITGQQVTESEGDEDFYDGEGDPEEYFETRMQYMIQMLQEEYKEKSGRELDEDTARQIIIDEGYIEQLEEQYDYGSGEGEYDMEDFEPDQYPQGESPESQESPENNNRNSF